jgi:two-component system chemotaxis sensor kinase CheA
LISPRRRLPIALIALGILLFVIAQTALASVNAISDTRAYQATTAVDMAGYQRTLTQRMLAMALLMQRYEHQGNAVIAPHAELAAAAHNFDVTFRAFQQGGATDDSTGSRIAVDALRSPGERAIMQRIGGLWMLLRAKILSLGDVVPAPDTIDELAATANTSASELSVMMNALSEEIRKSSAQELDRLGQRRDMLTMLTVFGLFSIIAGFFLHVVDRRRVLKQIAENLQERNAELAESAAELAESAAALSASKAQQDRIMETVRQGLFLIDANSVIQGEYARDLERIFRATDLKGVKLLDILRRLLPPKMFDTSCDYVDLLFDRTKRERTVFDVNPLNEIEVNFPDPKGGFTARWLSFSFQRIVEDDRITSVFVALSDVTDRVTFEREAREAESRRQRQLEMLMSVLHIEPEAQAEFIATTNEQLREMNEALRPVVVVGRDKNHDDVFRQRLNTVFRCVHTIKGNASLLQIEYFRKAAERFEEKIAELRSRGKISGDDFIGIVVLQAEMRSDLDELQDIRRRLGGLRVTAGLPAISNVAPKALRGSLGSTEGVETDGGDLLLENLASLTADLGRRLGKEVVLDSRYLRTNEFGFEQRRFLKDVLVQVVRNGVAHGIERPEVRSAVGKPVRGTIVLRSLQADAGFTAFAYRDDGNGIDVDEVRRVAAAQGIVTENDVREMDDSEAVSLIFCPGFTTANVSDEAAGRGVGMDIVKQIIVDRLGGEIDLSSRPGEFFELSFTIPTPAYSMSSLET